MFNDHNKKSINEYLAKGRPRSKKEIKGVFVDRDEWEAVQAYAKKHNCPPKFLAKTLIQYGIDAVMDQMKHEL
tara:strand:- start:387 stop:605 length:219 start_codon:yes stop_codon:yes gene_type:complete